jgi:hypothetical protein
MSTPAVTAPSPTPRPPHVLRLHAHPVARSHLRTPPAAVLPSCRLVEDARGSPVRDASSEAPARPSARASLRRGHTTLAQAPSPACVYQAVLGQIVGTAPLTSLEPQALGMHDPSQARVFLDTSWHLRRCSAVLYQISESFPYCKMPSSVAFSSTSASPLVHTVLATVSGQLSHLGRVPGAQPLRGRRARRCGESLVCRRSTPAPFQILDRVLDAPSASFLEVRYGLQNTFKRRSTLYRPSRASTLALLVSIDFICTVGHRWQSCCEHYLCWAFCSPLFAEAMLRMRARFQMFWMPTPLHRLGTTASSRGGDRYHISALLPDG